MVENMSIYNFKYQTIEGKEASLADFKDKVVLIVNTASECGFTPQYEGLEKLYKEYKDQGLVVIGFPCNQFNGQEPGSNSDVKEFCSVRYGVTFPLSQKIDVRGENQDTLYKYLTDNTTFEGFGTGEMAELLDGIARETYKDEYKDSSIKWNFTKFLIGRDGNIISRFEPTVDPLSIEKDIKNAL